MEATNMEAGDIEQEFRAALSFLVHTRPSKSSWSASYETPQRSPPELRDKLAELTSLELQSSFGSIARVRETQGDDTAAECVQRAASTTVRGFSANLEDGVSCTSFAGVAEAEVTRLWEGLGVMSRSDAMCTHVRLLERVAPAFGRELEQLRGRALNANAHIGQKDCPAALAVHRETARGLRSSGERRAPVPFYALTPALAGSNVVPNSAAAKMGREECDAENDVISPSTASQAGAAGGGGGRLEVDVDAPVESHGDWDDGNSTRSRSQSARGGALASRKRKPRPVALPLSRNYAPNPLGLFNTFGTMRKKVVLFVEWPWFDRVIVVCILYGSFVMAVEDPSKFDPATGKSILPLWQHYSHQALTAIFYVEFFCKIAAMGFVFGERAYLKDPWNWLDFLVIISSTIELLLEYVPGAPKVQVTALRVFRVLRPLRSVNRFPAMRALVVSLLGSLPALSSVVGIIFSLIAFWGLMGVQLWGIDGALKGRCRTTPFPVLWEQPVGDGLTVATIFANITNAWGEEPRPLWLLPCIPVGSDPSKGLVGPGPNGVDQRSSAWYQPRKCAWPIVQDGPGAGRACTSAGSGGTFSCPNGTWCGSDWDAFGNSRFVDPKLQRASLYNEDFNWGFKTFDNLGDGIVTLFEAITLEAWTATAYEVQDGFHKAVASWYFVLLVLLGAFIIVNLGLAVMSDAFSENQEDQRCKAHEQQMTAKFGSIDVEKRGYIDIEQLCETEEVMSLTDEEFEQMISNADREDTGRIYLDRFIRAMDFCMKVNPKCDPVLMAHLQLQSGRDPGIPQELGVGLLVKRVTGNYPRALRYHAKCLRPLAKSGRLESFIVFCIVTNTGFLMAYRHPPEGVDPNTFRQELQVLEIGGFVLSAIFVLELIVKLLGFGLTDYFCDAFNCLDAITVAASIFEVVLQPPAFFSGDLPPLTSSGGMVSALRTLRVFRVLKLANKFEGLQKMTHVTIRMVKSVLYFGALLLLLVFMFALLGVQLFANKLKFDEEGYPVPPTDSRWTSLDTTRVNFDSTGDALFAVFQILTGEDWNMVMYDARRATGGVALVYFLITFTVGNFVMLNLFIAILLGNFDNETRLEEVRKQIEAREARIAKEEKAKSAEALEMQEKHADGVRQLKRSLSGLNVDNAPTTGERSEDENEKEDQVQEQNQNQNQDRAPEQDDGVAFRSLFILSRTCPLRRHLMVVVRHRYFEGFIIFMIFVSSLLLALENPMANPDATMTRTISILDEVVSYIFMAECVIKIVALGFCCYLRNNWNRLDFFIVCISVFNICAQTFLSPEVIQRLSFLRALRALRALRPLRLLSRHKGLQAVIFALWASIPNMVNVVLIILLVFVIFAIIGVFIFKGVFYKCGGPDGAWDALSEEQRLLVTQPVPHAQLSATQRAWASGAYIGATSRSVCEWLGTNDGVTAGAGLLWGRAIPQSFDNIFTSTITLFEMATTEAWVTINSNCIDGVGVDMQPIENNMPNASAFGIGVIVVFSFFLMNLFVGVVVDNFNRLKKANKGASILLTSEQHAWADAQRMIKSVRPAHVTKRPRGATIWTWFQIVCFELSEPFNGSMYATFENVIMACIVANTSFMAYSHFGQSDMTTDVLFYANWVFASIFTLEALIKISGIGLRQYMLSGWNRFDFVIVLASDVSLFVPEAGTLASMVRVLRLGRLLRLARKMKTLRALCRTLFLTLPQLLNVACLLALLMFIYAVLGINLFGKVRLGSSLNHHANFQTFSGAIFVLMRCVTGEFWNGIMYDLAASYDVDNMPKAACVEDPQWNASVCGFHGAPSPPMCEPINGCGTGIAYAYFVSFTLIVSFVFVNLFVAVILEGFDASNALEGGDDEANGDMPALSVEHYRRFCATWMKYDPNLSWTLTKEKLYVFLCELEPPMGLGLEFQPPAEQMQSMVEPMQLTEFEHEGENIYEFEDVSQSLAKYVVMQHHSVERSALESAESCKLGTKLKEDEEIELDKGGGSDTGARDAAHASPRHLAPLNASQLQRQRDLQIISERDMLSGRLGQLAGQV